MRSVRGTGRLQFWNIQFFPLLGPTVHRLMALVVLLLYGEHCLPSVGKDKEGNVFCISPRKFD